MAAVKSAYDWRFGSGRPCLDLVATGTGTSGVCELLDDAGRLADWLLATGLVPNGTHLGAVDDSRVVRFRQPRAGVERLLTAEIGGDRRPEGALDALERVNALAAEPPPGLRAVRGGGGTSIRTLNGDPECGALPAAVARDAVELLTDPVARAGLRRCEADNCRRLHLRERVARHRRRVAAAAAVTAVADADPA
ncbi:ABATE domain-containing protein [Streptomyces sp. NPDC002476]|uniref:ABATE domain-containing protein n=1 Tax=Streptomyces sp. NPDC002476 TaxID=3364648 RepID=UPI0036B5487A